MEDAALEQGAASGLVGTLPGPSQFARGEVCRAIGRCVMGQEAAARAGRRERDVASFRRRPGGIRPTTGGDYGEEGFVYQDLAPLRSFDGKYPVIGSWVIGHQQDGRAPSDVAAGIGIRESDTPITTNLSQFVPPPARVGRWRRGPIRPTGTSTSGPARRPSIPKCVLPDRSTTTVRNSQLGQRLMQLLHGAELPAVIRSARQEQPGNRPRHDHRVLASAASVHRYRRPAQLPAKSSNPRSTSPLITLTLANRPG